MSPLNNPFVRGYDHLRVERQLVITHEDDCPPIYRPLHPSQSRLRDDQVRQHPCIFCDDFALVTEGQSVPDALDDHCLESGIVRTVVYAVMADDAGHPVHVGDTGSESAAREVIRRLCFVTGHYSRCWEINSSHITPEAMRCLSAFADIATPTRLLFVAFRIPYSFAVGVKLIATPWTSEHLEQIDGQNAAQLRREHLAAGLPKALANVLHLAALADTRFLIFDPDAPVIDRLTVYDYD